MRTPTAGAVPSHLSTRKMLRHNRSFVPNSRHFHLQRNRELSQIDLPHKPINAQL